MIDVLDVFRQEGRTEGRARTLLELIAARFGSIPREAKARIEAAGEAELSRWALRVLTAPTLEAVLDEKSKKVAPARKPAARKPAARKPARAQ